jgi:hypothetical protein
LIPDFVYIDEDNNNYIAIELDEPYTLTNNNEKKPIHFLGSDDLRNKQLLNYGWNVIRFAEEQIALQTADCVELIDCFVRGDTNNGINQIKCWSEDESKSMIEINYRDHYLPIKLSDRISNNSSLSYRSFFIFHILFSPNENYPNRIELILTKENKESGNVCHYCYINDGKKFLEKFHYTLWEKVPEIDELNDSEIMNRKKISLFKDDVRYDLFDYLISENDIVFKLEGIGTENNYFFNLLDLTHFKLNIVGNKISTLYEKIQEFWRREDERKNRQEELERLEAEIKRLKEGSRNY